MSPNPEANRRNETSKNIEKIITIQKTRTVAGVTGGGGGASESAEKGELYKEGRE